MRAAHRNMATAVAHETLCAVNALADLHEDVPDRRVVALQVLLRAVALLAAEISDGHPDRAARLYAEALADNAQALSGPSAQILAFARRGQPGVTA